MKQNPTKIDTLQNQGQSTLNLKRTDFAPNCIWSFHVPDSERLNEELTAMIETERNLTPESRNCAGREMW